MAPLHADREQLQRGRRLTRRRAGRSAPLTTFGERRSDHPPDHAPDQGDDGRGQRLDAEPQGAAEDRRPRREHDRGGPRGDPAAHPAVRPPINDAAAGIARNARYQTGNPALVDGAPTSAANPAPIVPSVWTPDRVSRATVIAPTSRVVGTPIDVARIIVDWFGSRSACCTTRAAPLPPERPTNRAYAPVAPGSSAARIRNPANAHARPHQNAVKPPRAAPTHRTPQRPRASISARATDRPPIAPHEPHTASGRTTACHNTGRRWSIPNWGNPSVTNGATITIGTANPRAGAAPAIAAAIGRASSPRACSRPARKASTTTAIASAPIATSNTDPACTAERRDGVPGPVELRATNVTRTLASVSASPILNQDHGRYQPLTA